MKSKPMKPGSLSHPLTKAVIEDDEPAYYSSNFTLEDFNQIVKDLESDYERERKRSKEKKDDSWRQMVAIAKQPGGSLYKLDNGMFVSPNWCREYLKSLEDYGK